MPDCEGEPLVLWRAYVPKWAHMPLSGDGAARFGGRWNPSGMPCLYLALELSTAWAEYNQNIGQHPALIVKLELSGAKLADLTTSAGLTAANVSPAIHDIEWRHELDQGRTPETYAIQERLAASGYDGLLYPSFMSRGGHCLALWQWNSPNAPSLVAIDPEGRLPKNAASWT